MTATLEHRAGAPAQHEPVATEQPIRQGTVRRRGLGYQPALDGLRAIAVLGVLAYHADLPWAPGGFLGVDVFFVLSGFLITSLLLEATARHGTPDLRRFYLRRARRLLPALFAVLIGSTLLVITLAPDAAGHQQRDLPAALTYITNWVYVLTDQSYFEATGRPPMLEHLWSLAVEEQFYLLWPWVFLLAWRLGRARIVRRVALIGALLSTAAMLVLSVANGDPEQADPSRVYFGTDTHAMGLLIGAALATAWVPARARADLAPRPRAIIDSVGVLALLLLAAVFWRVSEDSELLYRGGFLALSALVALVIVALTHPASRLGGIIGSAPLRYLGTRSYGIYLWHWPVFLVTRPGLDVPMTGAANLLLRLGLTLGIAELSYRFLETPIRRYGFRESWYRLRDRMLAGPGPVARAAARPVVLIAIAGVVLGGMTVRLYSLPAQADYLDGVTSLSVLPEQGGAGPDGSGAPPESAAPPLIAAPEGRSGDEPGTAAPPAAQAAAPPGQLGLGESVLIGASASLQRQFPDMVIDAEVGRQQDDMVERIAELASANALRNEVVLHVGSNGYIGENSVAAMLDTLTAGGVQRIVVLNVSVPRRWQDPNNAVLASVVPRYSNAILMDWAAEVRDDPDLVVADGVHPTGPGIRKFTELIGQGLATLQAQDTAAESEDEFVDDEPILQGSLSA
jgi:peptidoglycan/LPS O-acetylase OafA/YrhL